MFRIGHGYDLHKLVLNRPLILCGETIPFDKGLLGHSDADVATHALMDSLLGAAGLFDIGYHFKETDDQYKNIKSLILLEKVYNMLEEKRFKISNIDLTIVLEKPKLSPFNEKMKKNIADILKLKTNQINIKATTEEGCGLTGSSDCAAAFCNSLIYEF